MLNGLEQIYLVEIVYNNILSNHLLGNLDYTLRLRDLLKSFCGRNILEKIQGIKFAKSKFCYVQNNQVCVL